MEIGWITALGVGGATMVGAVAGFAIRKVSKLVTSLAAGIMLSAAVWGLILPALEYGNAPTTVLGIFFGALVLDFADRLLYRRKNADARLLFVAAIAIHNFPEGIAAGVGLATENLAQAFTISAGIALQNIPEGMIIIAPMLAAGYSPIKTLLIAIFTGLVEIAGTILGYSAISLAQSILPFALSFAGGTMLYVICTEMLPEARNTPYGVLAGFSAMILISSLLG